MSQMQGSTSKSELLILCPCVFYATPNTESGVCNQTGRGSLYMHVLSFVQRPC